MLLIVQPVQDGYTSFPRQNDKLSPIRVSDWGLHIACFSSLAVIGSLNTGCTYLSGLQVRIIIPGHIGGRMVKWLEEIEVAEAESDNHYHFMDNRVLPSHVDEALAKEEGMPPQTYLHGVDSNRNICLRCHWQTERW